MTTHTHTPTLTLTGSTELPHAPRSQKTRGSGPPEVTRSSISDATAWEYE